LVLLLPLRDVVEDVAVHLNTVDFFICVQDQDRVAGCDFVSAHQLSHEGTVAMYTPQGLDWFVDDGRHVFHGQLPVSGCLDR
jgi:hypothetical protein